MDSFTEIKQFRTITHKERTMSDAVSREIIKKEVIEALQLATESPKEIQESDSFYKDLGMSSSFHKAMSVPYTKILRKYSNNTIGPSEIVNNKIVGNDVDLVYSKANKR